MAEHYHDPAPVASFRPAPCVPIACMKTMERIFLAYLSFALMMLWLAGLVSGRAPWLAWSFGVASLISVVGSFSENRLVTATVATGIGAWMGVLFLIAVAAQNGYWMTYWPAPFAALYLALGAGSAYVWVQHQRRHHA
jgi:hypothetical protein